MAEHLKSADPAEGVPEASIGTGMKKRRPRAAPRPRPPRQPVQAALARVYRAIEVKVLVEPLPQLLPGPRSRRT